MMVRPNREHYTISQTVEWLKNHQFIVILPFWFVLSLVGLYGIYQALDYFHIKILEKISTPFVLTLCFSIIITLVRVIIYLLNHFPVVSTNTSSNVIEENDSLIEMMKEAESHSRWAEIIKIGSALSDVLWFTSRKKLRVAIGHFVEAASRQSGDLYTLSSTLIEDLGNTIMVLGHPDEGIKYIKRGIRIAEDNSFQFLIMRGYRNLANCYSFKKDPVNADINLKKAEEAANCITNDVEKYEALGAIEYARCKIFEKQGHFNEAIQALDKAMEYYNSLSAKYPETKKRNDDRLVKIHREKGVIYLSIHTEESTDNAYDALMSGLHLAQETLNYDNIIRCCTLLAKIQIQRKAIDAAEGMINIAKDCISKIDTPSIINEYNQVVRELELEKYASR